MGISGGIKMIRSTIYTVSLVLILGLLLPGGLVLQSDPAFAQSRSLGKVNFKTSCNRKAQKRINIAVALISCFVDGSFDP